MDALVNHNIYLSQFGKKFFTVTVLQLSLRPLMKIIFIVNYLKFLQFRHNLYNQKKRSLLIINAGVPCRFKSLANCVSEKMF